MKDRKSIKKIYLINPGLFLRPSGCARRARDAQGKRPDVEIVGDEMHPLLKITDFAPYVARSRHRVRIA